MKAEKANSVNSPWLQFFGEGALNRIENIIGENALEQKKRNSD